MFRFSSFLRVLMCVMCLAGAVAAQEVPFGPERWETRASESRVVEHLGRTSLYLKGGHAYVKGSSFIDGIIEFDMAVTGERGFMGGLWRVQPGGNYEEFYIRPHQSGNPDANQYTPGHFGLTSWQLYHGEGYGAPTVYKFNEWISIRIVVAGSQAEIFINDMEKPAVYAHELKREIQAGRVGLSNGNFAGAHFSRFHVTPMSTPPALKSPRRTPVQAPAGTVMSWQVSDAFDEKSLESKLQLSAADKSARTWKTLAAESTGITNLAQVQGIREGKDTAFARIVIVSDTEQVKKMRFAFSDRVKVYVNGRLVYGGQDDYRSRDYRFLGTIGLFDELYLPLRKGENEVWLAVSESFGGWGVKAAFDDLKGIRLK